jgi:hypothetical protein
MNPSGINEEKMGSRISWNNVREAGPRTIATVKVEARSKLLAVKASEVATKGSVK